MRIIWGPRNHHVGLVVWTFRVEGTGWVPGAQWAAVVPAPDLNSFFTNRGKAARAAHAHSGRF